MVITLVGPNRFAKIRELHKLLGQNPVVRVTGQEGVAIWTEVIGQASLFGDAPMVVADDLDQEATTSDLQAIADHLQNQSIVSSDQTVVFLFTDNKYENSPLATIVKEGRVLNFPQPTPAKLSLWAQQYAAEQEVVIDKPALPILLQKCNFDQFAVASEIARWSHAKSPRITLANIADIASLNTDANGFDVANALANKNLSQALQSLHTLQRQGLPSQAIIGSLAWKLESMLQKAQISPNQVVQKWTKSQLSQTIKDLYQIDLQSKQGKITHLSIHLEAWLIQSIGG